MNPREKRNTETILSAKPLLTRLAGGICLSAFLVLSTSAHSTNTNQNPCLHAIKKYGVTQGVPFNVLYGIASVESNLKPWALNVKGRSVYLQDRQKTISVVSRLLKRGIYSFDVGCMQMNVKWHHERFQNISQLVDPNHNVYHAAKFLNELYHEKGTWSAAVAAYHSRTPSRGRAYLQAVRSKLTRKGAQ